MLQEGERGVRETIGGNESCDEWAVSLTQECVAMNVFLNVPLLNETMNVDVCCMNVFCVHVCVLGMGPGYPLSPHDPQNTFVCGSPCQIFFHRKKLSYFCIDMV